MAAKDSWRLHGGCSRHSLVVTWTEETELGIQQDEHVGARRQSPRGTGSLSENPRGPRDREWSVSTAQHQHTREVLRLETEAPTRIIGSGPKSPGLGQALVPKAQVESSRIGGIS